MLTIWGRISALGVQKVIWAADEVGRSYRRLDAGQDLGVVNTEEYRRINPNGKVPTIDDDGVVLWESNVIVRYLCARYGTNDIYPADLVRRMEAERWMDWQATEVQESYRIAFNVFARGLHYVAVPAYAEQCFNQLNALLAMLDAELAHRPYVAGDLFSMGDIPIGVVVHNWMQIERPLPELKHLARWYDRLSARPGAAWLMAWNKMDGYMQQPSSLARAAARAS